MNDSAIYRSDEIEISIADMFWSVLRRWRSIIVCMLIFGVLIGGYSFIKEYKSYKDPEKREESQEAYDQAVVDYEKKKAKLERELENAQRFQEQLDYFNEHGVYLKIDPYNLYKIEATYYVDSHYEIMPGSSYQNTNKIAALIRSYRNAISRMDLESIIDVDGEDVTLFSPVSNFTSSDIFNMSVDESSGLMQLTIIGDTKERAETLYNTIDSVIDGSYDLFVEVIGDHEINKTIERARYTLDYSWDTKQINYRTNQYEKNLATIETKEKALKDLKEPEKDVLSKSSVIKKAIKGGIIGLVAGLIIAAVVYAARFILGGRVNNPDEIRTRYNMPLLGTINQNNKKQTKLDKAIAARLGIDENMTSDQAAGLIASNIRLYLKDCGKVLLIGNAGEDAARQLKNQLSAVLSGVEVISSGNINADPAAIDALGEDTAVVCVEEWQRSKHLDIIKELEKLKVSESKGTGFVIVY